MGNVSGRGVQGNALFSLHAGRIKLFPLCPVQIQPGARLRAAILNQSAVPAPLRKQRLFLPGEISDRSGRFIHLKAQLRSGEFHRCPCISQLPVLFHPVHGDAGTDAFRHLRSLHKGHPHNGASHRAEPQHAVTALQIQAVCILSAPAHCQVRSGAARRAKMICGRHIPKSGETAG